MLEMLKERKAALEAQGKKGFTLMEMLIVIAIIAILIAIAIPIFTAQLNSAKHAADEANARSIYAIAMADYMDNSKYDGSYTVSGKTVTVTNGSDSQTFEMSDIGTITIENTTNTDGKATAAPKITVTWSQGDFNDVVLPNNPTGA